MAKFYRWYCSSFTGVGSTGIRPWSTYHVLHAKKPKRCFFLPSEWFLHCFFSRLWFNWAREEKFCFSVTSSWWGIALPVCRVCRLDFLFVPLAAGRRIVDGGVVVVDWWRESYGADREPVVCVTSRIFQMTLRSDEKFITIFSFWIFRLVEKIRLPYQVLRRSRRILYCSAVEEKSFSFYFFCHGTGKV